MKPFNWLGHRLVQSGLKLASPPPLFPPMQFVTSMVPSTTFLPAIFRHFLLFAASASICLANPIQATTEQISGQIIVKNDRIQRCLQQEGDIWKTAWVSQADGTGKQFLHSDEFRIRLLDGSEFSLQDYRSKSAPRVTDASVVIQYIPLEKTSSLAPSQITITYQAFPEGLRKTITLEGAPERSIDILEVERFSTTLHATFGGRGQPVFLGDRWFVGLEHPAGHSRHTDGNSPTADSACFELVGNYSFVDLEGADIDPSPREGLVRLFHFPIARAGIPIQSQTAILGCIPPGQSVEQGFYEYLDQIAKRPRSFTHYNNWFDGAGKNLKSESFTKIALALMEAIQPYGIKLDAMVPDNGWQDRQSVWEPSRSQFPDGMNDLEKLGRSLQASGSSLGLWLSLDSTTCDIPWGESQGFIKALPNRYFAQYFPHYSLSHERYKEALTKQLQELIRRGNLTYFKHDFNHLSDLGEHSSHPGTDRHGHEAEVDSMLDLLEHCRQVNPEIYQNLTNWVWFSPWWLMHGDALWMLAGDDGFNKNTPELSARAMATTDRDTYLWRMWGQPGCRPLVPISRLMTHGIIRNPGGQMESPEDTLIDWADHVMMYYGRGVQMKEWYITPSAMTAEHWRVLGTIHAWSDHHFNALRNVVYVGGRPDEGNVYGYFGWHSNEGVLTARNPSPRPQILRVPLAPSSFLRSSPTKTSNNHLFQTRIVYPHFSHYRDFASTSKVLEFEIPGYSTMTFEIALNEVHSSQPPTVRHENTTPIKIANGEFSLPDEEMGRCEILVIGYPVAPGLRINGKDQTPIRSTQGAVNQFASYARAGMESQSARMWTMASYDLSNYRGKEVQFDIDTVAFEEGTYEAWLLVEHGSNEIDEHEVKNSANNRTATTNPLPWAILDGFRRVTYPLISERKVSPIAQRELTDDELETIRQAKLVIEAFGVQEGEFGKKQVLLNDEAIGNLPAGGDSWQRLIIDLPASKIATLHPHNVVTVQHNGKADKFKFRGARLIVQLADGQQISTSVQDDTQTSYADWSYAEGKTFPGSTSHPILIKFRAKE